MVPGRGDAKSEVFYGAAPGTLMDWRPAIRALLYGVQFEDDPTQAIERVVETVAKKGALGLEPDDYRNAIISALASDEALARLIPHGHSDETIRRFLALVLDQLQEIAPTSGPWAVVGRDAFGGEDYPISNHATEAEARAAAEEFLDVLEREQPAAQSGGQDGIQDRVFIVSPNGHHYRVMPSS